MKLLMDKADQGTGGAVVNVIAYQGDYVLAREELKVIDASAQRPGLSPGDREAPGRARRRESVCANAAGRHGRLIHRGHSGKTQEGTAAARSAELAARKVDGLPRK